MPNKQDNPTRLSMPREVTATIFWSPTGSLRLRERPEGIALTALCLLYSSSFKPRRRVTVSGVLIKSQTVILYKSMTDFPFFNTWLARTAHA